MTRYRCTRAQRHNLARTNDCSVVYFGGASIVPRCEYRKGANLQGANKSSILGVTIDFHQKSKRSVLNCQCVFAAFVCFCKSLCLQ